MDVKLILITTVQLPSLWWEDERVRSSVLTDLPRRKDMSSITFLSRCGYFFKSLKECYICLENVGLSAFLAWKLVLKILKKLVEEVFYKGVQCYRIRAVALNLNLLEAVWNMGKVLIFIQLVCGPSESGTNERLTLVAEGVFWLVAMRYLSEILSSSLWWLHIGPDFGDRDHCFFPYLVQVLCCLAKALSITWARRHDSIVFPDGTSPSDVECSEYMDLLIWVAFPGRKTQKLHQYYLVKERRRKNNLLYWVISGMSTILYLYHSNSWSVLYFSAESSGKLSIVICYSCRIFETVVSKKYQFTYVCIYKVYTVQLSNL